MKDKIIHLIGIKGTGMASLAKILYDLDYKLQGSDIDRHFFTEDSLRERDILILPFKADNIKDDMVVVIGNAFGEDHEEVMAARNNPKVEAYRYHEFLGILMKDYRSITVSGSHGKTTTTTMLRDMLSKAQPTAYLIGDGMGKMAEDDVYFAVEACEFRRHFLAYHPDVAIMTNFEIDHVDYFKDDADYISAYNEFAANVKELIIAWGDDPKIGELAADVPIWTYGFKENNDIVAKIIAEEPKTTRFEVYWKGIKQGVMTLPIVGEHLVLDALAVIGAGLYEKIDFAVMEAGLQTFNGAKRRYVIEEGQENIYIDDYAHHPTEIRVTLEATRKRYPDHKLVAIFKPHRVGRVYRFVDAFAKALALADEVALCPFTSIDDAEEGIDIDITYLQDRIPGAVIIEDEEDVTVLAAWAPAVYVFMSSKDIYDLKDALKVMFHD